MGAVIEHLADAPEAAELDLAKLLAARRLAVTARPYLATALHAMAIVPTRAVPTMSVDGYWRCYVSPAFVAAMDVRELAVVWLHEVAHLLRDHHRRADALVERGERHKGPGTPAYDPAHPLRDRLRLNLAMDCEINDDLVDGLVDADGRPLELPQGTVTPGLLRLARRDLFEEYLRDLPPMALNGRHSWVDCGSGAHGLPAPWELDGSGAHPVGAHEAAAIRIRVREAVDRARGRGSVPRGWKRWAEGLGEPVQDWRVLLAGAFRGCLAGSGGAGDYTYRRPGRRTPALGGAVVLPSMRRPLPHVAVVIDTSGSVSDEELGSALSEVAGICRATGVAGNRVAVYSCDAGVHTAQQVCRAEEITLVGGGGTDLRRGFARALAAAPRPEVLVVLTDGATPWPEQPGCRVIAGIFGEPLRYRENGTQSGVRAPDWAESVYLR